MVEVGQPPHAVLALWLPAAIAAHLYVALFLWQLLRVARPQLCKRLVCWRSFKKQAADDFLVSEPLPAGEGSFCWSALSAATCACASS
jgi:hypothetical protein